MLFSSRAYSSSTSCSSGVRVSEPDGAEVCDAERWCVVEDVSVAIVSFSKLENLCRCMDGLYVNMCGWCYSGVYLQRGRCGQGLRIYRVKGGEL